MADSCPTKRLMQQTTMIGFLTKKKAMEVSEESVVEVNSQ